MAVGGVFGEGADGARVVRGPSGSVGIKVADEGAG
jgi:hypothetical protein